MESSGPLPVIERAYYDMVGLKINCMQSTALTD